MKTFSTQLLALLCFIALCASPACAQQEPLDKLVLLKKGYSQNSYPHAGSIFSFTVMAPGVILVPVAGGVYIAGWKKWFLMPSKAISSFAADYCEADSSCYFFAANKGKSLVVKSVGNEKSTSFSKVAEMPLGLYSLKVVSPQVTWIWGKQDNAWCIWRYNRNQLNLIYKSDLPIVDVAPLNENNVAVATRNTIITMGIKQAPKEVIKIDIGIDGLAIDADATLFVSTEKGILHYLSPDMAEDAEVVTYGIHGVLRRYHKSLYVLWQEDSQVVEIKL